MVLTGHQVVSARGFATSSSTGVAPESPLSESDQPIGISGLPACHQSDQVDGFIFHQRILHNLKQVAIIIQNLSGFFLYLVDNFADLRSIAIAVSLVSTVCEAAERPRKTTFIFREEGVPALQTDPTWSPRSVPFLLPAGYR